MSYCNPGDKPKVNFKFKGQSEQTYVSRYSPIDVTTREYSVNGANFRGEGYRLRFFSTNNGVWASAVVTDYNIRFIGESTFTSHLLDVRNCAGEWNYNVSWTKPDLVEVYNDASCPVTIPDTRKADIEIRNPANNVLIFKQTGNAPVNFTVACGDCPPGYCKCESRNYPGYCCVSCGELAKEVNTITQMVKAINNGK